MEEQLLREGQELPAGTPLNDSSQQQSAQLAGIDKEQLKDLLTDIVNEIGTSKRAFHKEVLGKLSSELAQAKIDFIATVERVEAKIDQLTKESK